MQQQQVTTYAILPRGFDIIQKYQTKRLRRISSKVKSTTTTYYLQL